MSGLPDTRKSASSELRLRLADVQAILDSVPYDEDGEPQVEHLGGLFSALDYAVRGASGCVEPEEWDAGRRAALDRHREYLGL